MRHAPPLCLRRPEPPNVVLISVDTLRADHLSCYGYERVTSPHLDAWAQSSAILFENAVAHAPWTLPSHTSMLTGLYANRHGVNYSHSVAPPSLLTLAEMLREADYTTAAVTGGSWLDPRFGLDQGFDHYHHWPTPGESEGELRRGVDEALRLWRTLRRPRFVFLHTFEVHDDFTRGKEKPDLHDISSFRVDSAELRRLYERSITSTDAELHRLFEELRTAPFQGSTLIVFTSDHGEGFGDRRPWGHSYLHENTLRVPLVLALPDGRGRGRRIPHQVRSVDIVPTVLDVAGLEIPSALDGVSLLPLLHDPAAEFPRTAFSYAPEGNRGISVRVDGRWKYIFNNGAWSPPHGREELYRLDRDPGESRHLAAHPKLRELRAAAHAYLRDVPGLRLAFNNAGATPLLFSIRSPSGLIRRHVVKSTVLPCDCVERPSDGEIRVNVPPGQPSAWSSSSLGKTDSSSKRRSPENPRGASSRASGSRTWNGPASWPGRPRDGPSCRRPILPPRGPSPALKCVGGAALTQPSDPHSTWIRSCVKGSRR